MKLKIIFFVLVIFSIKIYAQPITVVGNYTPQQLVNNVFTSGCVSIQNIVFSGHPGSIGYFDASGTSFDSIFSSGIIFSSGRAIDAVGPNYQSGISTSFGSPGDNDLNYIIPQATADASVIEFDFVPNSDTIKFRYIFGSDEYPEFVNSSFNDVFAFFLSGPYPWGGFYLNQNIATIPGTTTPVSINNVNNGTGSASTPPTGPCVNCQYYFDNLAISNPNSAIEYDGYTVALTATALVVPCQTYHLKLAVADAGDYIIDSAVFLEAGSFSSGESNGSDNVSIFNPIDTIYEGCTKYFIIYRNDTVNLSNPAMVLLQYAGNAIMGSDISIFPDTFWIQGGQMSDTIFYDVLNDGFPEQPETFIIETWADCICNTGASIFSSDTITIYSFVEFEAGITNSNSMICDIAASSPYTISAECTSHPSWFVSYIWNTGETSSDIVITSPPAGMTDVYWVEIIDLCGNSIIDSITIGASTLSGISLISQDASCFNSCNGEVNVTAIGASQQITYLWSDSTISSPNSGNITNLCAGNYNVTISNAIGCSVDSFFIIFQPDEILINEIISDYNGYGVSIFGAFDGSIDLTVSGGNPPFSFLWSNSETTEDIINLSADNYSITITDNSGCSIINSFEITEPIFMNYPDWSYSLSPNNHIILIQESTPITINSNQIEYGDFIGVFYDSLGTLVCGGYQMWENAVTSISAWSEEFGNDGFIVGEQLKWKIWDASDSIEYNANATYMPVPPMTQQEFFAINGLSGLTSLFTIPWTTSQQLVLPPGWSFFSTYIAPYEELFDSIFSNIISNVVIVKNYLGQIYWPAYGINYIGNLSINEGYQIKINNADSIIINGLSVEPENTPCNVPLGWSFIPYLRTDTASIAEMLSTIANDIEIVKNYLGEIYWPQYGINTIGNIIPGEGYQIKMNNAVTLTYPPNSANISKSNIQIPQPKHFKTTINTGSNMTLGIPKTAWETKPVMISEIGVFSVSGLLVGSGVYTGKNLAISIWGDDELTEEIDGLTGKFTLKIWNGESLNLSGEQILEIETWLEGDDFYETNKISVVEKISNIEHRLTNIEIFQNTPNPFSETTEIGIFLPEKTFVEIELFNLIGEKIETIQSQNYPHGKHTIIYERKKLSAGTYFYRLNSGDFSETRIMSIK